MINEGPIYYHANNNYPTEGMEAILYNLIENPNVIDAETYVVKRNGAVCRGVKQITLVYDGNGPIPVSTLRQIPIKTAIKEFIGYLRGYTNIYQFHGLGVTTWDKDATQNKSWLNNPNRKGEGDIGVVYGAYAKTLIGPNGEPKDLIAEVVEKLRSGNYDRRVILNYYDPFVRGALPACLYEHTFTVHKGRLNLSSVQRSCDASLGGAFNSIQCYFLLHFMAKLTGYTVGWITHTIHDLHIYENQIEAISAFIHNDPLPATALLNIGEKINKELSLAEFDLLTADEIFSVSGYLSHGKYDIPLTV
jgi:thymidylate synthase